MQCLHPRPGLELTVKSHFERFGYLFYAVNPNTTAFENPEEVPDYIVQVVPHVMYLILIENVILYYQKRRIVRVNDAIGSASHGFIQELSKTLVRGAHVTLYTYIYAKCRLITLPWNSPWTWLLSYLAMDFVYYWLHRACHEFNILWAAHQVHHSSEEFNLTTALRQAGVQYYFSWVFYIPVAFFIPPGVFIVHVQLNLLYQVWIHTEVIKNLGPLEYVLNTASHHRVHHGRNRYCIDKNYGGTLIIWDRMFGTFEAEKEEVVYGVTHPIKTFEFFELQLCHYKHIWKTFRTTEGLGNKLSVIFKGPGWSPGKPWNGCLEDVPDVKAPVEKYDPPLPVWCQIYALLHFTILTAIYIEIAENKRLLPEPILWGSVAYEVFSFSALGMMMEARMYMPWVEVFRCSAYFAMDYFFLPYTRLSAFPPIYQWCFILTLRSIYVSSILVWLQYCICIVAAKMQSSKTLNICWIVLLDFHHSLLRRMKTKNSDKNIQSNGKVDEATRQEPKQPVDKPGNSLGVNHSSGLSVITETTC